MIMSSLLLVDGNSIINRAYYATAGRAPMTAPDGTPTGAVNGFFNSVTGIVKEYAPDHVCVLFDRREPTFRHKMSADYKATRHGMPDDLAAQMPVVKEILDLIGIARMELTGYEADDLIGTLSRQGEQSGMTVYIYSGDHDDFQLISDKVSVIMPQSGKDKPSRVLYDRQLFEDTYGVSPEVFVQVKALMGDKSDNITGIDKVGEKTAFRLIAEYGSVAGVYENAANLPPALKTKISASKDLLDLNLKLCAIDREVPVPYGIDGTSYSGGIRDTQGLADRLGSLQLRSLIKKFGIEGIRMSAGSVSPAFAGSDDSRNDLADELCGRLDELVKRLNEDPDGIFEPAGSLPDLDMSGNDKIRFGVDFVRVSDETGVVFCDADDSKFYLLGEDEAIRLCDREGGITVAGFEYKLRSKLCKAPLRVVTAVHDVELAGFVMNTIEGKPDYDRLFASVTGRNCPDITQDSKEKQMSIEDLASGSESISKAGAQAAVMLYATLIIARIQEEEIYKDDKLCRLLCDIEFPLVVTLDTIERNGMHVARERLNALHLEYSRRLEDISARIYDIVGEEFNINSPRQLAQVLYDADRLGLPHGKKGKSGAFSTGIDELNRIKHLHPVIDLLIEYRELSKLDFTYADGLTRTIGPDDRIHTTFTQAMTNTGRLSSTDPNLQNIPVRSEEGARLREAFTAPEGRILVDADYSQIELRLLAALSNDPTMSSAFIEGKDIHRRTAARIYGVDEAMVTNRMRASAKTVNFSIIYGISDYGLSNDLDISFREAGDLIKEYSNQFPGIMNYLDSLKRDGEKNGYVETLFGRKRVLAELKSQNRNIRNFGLRAAMNTPIQGTAADIIKVAMNRVADSLRRNLPGALLVMQVHDELIVECDISDSEKAASILKCEMESAITLSVPLIADVHTGKDWRSAK